MPTRAGRSRRFLLQLTTLDVEGRPVAMAIRRNLRARRLYLRVDPADADIELILPRNVAIEEGLRFAREKRDWVAARLAAIPVRQPFADGATIPLLDESLTIRHRPDARGAVRRDGADLIVTGAAEHLPRRVRDWLKREAKHVLAARSRDVAARIGRRIAHVRVGDPKSRWGSCSAKGRLAYSWRLILAPSLVLDYVVAHEVAHLVEHNHGRRFWKLVDELATEAETGKAWLRRHGAVLLRYG